MPEAINLILQKRDTVHRWNHEAIHVAKNVAKNMREEQADNCGCPATKGSSAACYDNLKSGIHSHNLNFDNFIDGILVGMHFFLGESR